MKCLAYFIPVTTNPPLQETLTLGTDQSVLAAFPPGVVPCPSLKPLIQQRERDTSTN